MTLLAMYRRHTQRAHTEEQRTAAASGLADELQSDTCPADLVWAADATRILTAEEMAVVYPTWGEPRPRVPDEVPLYDSPNFWRAAARLIEVFVGVVVFLLVGSFVIAQAARFW